MKARYLIPLVIFVGLVALLGVGLTLNPRDVPSVLIDKPVSDFSLPDLLEPGRMVESKSMRGKVWLINVWGTWCPECWREHDFLLYLARREQVPIIGIDWRDDPDEARQFLAEKGNPFIAVGVDPESTAIMDLGVYGAPETFLIDQQGVIRKKHKGAMNPDVWQSEFKPLIASLEKGE
ncbi:MAG: DsbE family thiol:disulfide interchange protein [Gammaproteobacteria bacterium]|nr:DsbE family thiol:disulfide interchange protein [Gammaproteobacteria bacterium]